MWLQIRMYLLLAAMFAIVYAIVVVAASIAGIQSFLAYALFAVVLLGVQYLISPKIVEMSMGVRYVSESEAPELHRMVEELARRAGIPKPKVGISRLPIPNAFAFGRWRSDGRVCVTEQLLNVLTEEELRAVLGHEISHLKNRDVTVITALSVVPMVLWYLAWSFMWSGGRNRGNAVALGIAAFLLYFITNLLVLYGSRIREYYADEGSVKLGNPPHALASALYKLVYGSARVDRETLRQLQGYRAFFANDPARAYHEVRELRQVDANLDGSIDANELLALSSKPVRLSLADRLMEAFSTHPNMVARVKRLSELAARRA
ncbi:MAG: M48 family metalloprotease [Euryarchaeota archaeon]|nr:M48 family metalloprotease [Euryarchaeota archaeon]